MSNITYLLNGQEKNCQIDPQMKFAYGKDEFLSNEQNDITYNQSWYEKGHASIPFLLNQEFANLQKGLAKCIETIIQTELGQDTENFELSKYHEIVKTKEQHFKVVAKTRDLFPEDFTFPINEIIPKFEKNLGFQLTDIDPITKAKIHIIVRINRPQSTDFNPPHKDIYEAVDKDNYVQKLVNFWVPICGVTDKSSLPLVESSHLINENRILRTFEGGIVSGNQYRVRLIKEWDGNNEMKRCHVNYGEYLTFTPHLIHGLAFNEETDITRVALEFRLFKK